MSGQRTRIDAVAVAILVVCCASWGLQQVAVKLAAPGIAPFLQAGLRSAVATLLLLGWVVVRRERLFERDGTLWWGIAAGLLFGSEFLLIYWGLEYTYASRAVVFLYLSPFVVALGAHWFIPGERLRPLQVAGLLLAFGGILSAFGESLSLPDADMLVGDAMLIAAAVLWGATTVLIKAGPLATAAPSKTLFYQLGVSAVLLLGASAIAGESPVVDWTPVVIGSLLYQTVWVAFISYLGWFWLVRHYPASRLASFTFLTPLFGVLAGAWVLNEPLTPVLLVALLLVAAGIYLVNRAAPVQALRAPLRTETD